MNAFIQFLLLQIIQTVLSVCDTLVTHQTADCFVVVASQRIFFLTAHTSSSKRFNSGEIRPVVHPTRLLCIFFHSSVSSLADQFPGLQSKMRVVLRVEVEAVKFLKEEPHRLDALLKRCKTITETLTTMRKYDSVHAGRQETCCRC